MDIRGVELGLRNCLDLLGSEGRMIFPGTLPSVPFGYRRVPRRDGVAAHAEIVESEASIVRHIFDAYVNRGLTVRQIAKQLTLDHIPTPKRAKQWHCSVVDEILRAEAYIGTCYYNRHQYLPVAGVLARSLSGLRRDGERKNHESFFD